MFWIPILALLSAHGSKEYFDKWQFLWWIIFPLALLVLEKLGQLYATLFRKNTIAKLEFLGSELINLQIHKPKSFNYSAG